MNEQTTTNTTFKNVIAIGGFIILLIVGIWSAIQVITFVPRLFSDTGVATDTHTESGVVGDIELGDRDIAAQLSTETAQSGESVLLNWAHTGNNEGVLSFSYACKEGFYFQIADRPVPCNAPYNLPATDTSLMIIPLSAKERIEAPLAITYTNSDGQSVRDTQTLTVLNTVAMQDDAETPETTENDGTTDTRGPIEPEDTATPPTPKVVVPKPAVETIRVPRASDPYGTADLKVDVLAIGDINPHGAFEPKGIVHPYARGAVKFKVTNLGTKETGPWYFNAILPTQGGYPFNSQAQPTLMPGSSTEIFMTFDQLVPGVHSFNVHVDPTNRIHEWSDLNNTAQQLITVLSY